MSESRAKKPAGKFESPYQRVLILVGLIIAVIAAIFLFNVVARGLGGDEKRLIEAITTTLKQPRINGEFSLAQQAQTNTFDAKGTFSVDNLKQAALKGEINGSFQGETLNVPIQIHGDLEKNTTYIRVSNAQKLADTIGGSAPTIKNDLNSIATKINEKWLQIKQSDNKANTCTAALFDKIANDPATAGELTSAYAGNRFLNVESVEQKDGGKQEFTVKYDNKAMEGFIKSLKTKELFKSTKDCDTTYDPLGTEAAATQGAQQSAQAKDANTSTTKITVDSDNKITNFVSVSSVNNQVNTTRISLGYNPGDKLVPPTQDIVDYSSLQKELSSLGQIFQQQQQSAASSQIAQ